MDFFFMQFRKNVWVISEYCLLICIKNPPIHCLFDPHHGGHADGVVFKINLLVQQSFDPDGVY
jgi:hypothetical protein